MASFESALDRSGTTNERSSTSSLVDLSRGHFVVQRTDSGHEAGNDAGSSLLVTPISTVIKDAGSVHSDSSKRDPLLETTSPWAQHAYLRAKEVMSPQQFETFKRMMIAFADRNENSAEVDGTYQQISRLLDASAGAIPQDQRRDAALGILVHAANPDSAGQGGNDTCALAGLETREYARSPAQTAEIVATAALTGQWTAPDGKQIKLDPGGLPLNGDDQSATPGFNRDEASRLFQVAMLNDISQRQPTPLYFSGRQGEGLTYANGHSVEPGGAPRLMGLPPSEVAKLAQRDFGDSNFFLINSEMAKTEKINPAGLTEFQSPTALQQELQHGGGFPYEIAVNGTKLYGAMGTPHHVVRLLGQDPASGDITVSDPNFPGLTQAIPVNELYEASL